MLRFISCTLVILMSLTVLLSVSGNVRAHSGHDGNSHHDMVSDMDDMSKPFSHDPFSSHADICGMTVCGPFVEELVDLGIGHACGFTSCILDHGAFVRFD